jgi:RNA polymerase sigma factor (sigma-70 family)
MDAMTPDPRFAADLLLARQAADGSEPHWHAIVERYSPVIRSVIRRYVRDDDDVRAIWTAVLERLRHGLLGQFQGQSTLATWLVLVARSEACDHVRRVRGRRRLPERLVGQPELLVAAFTEIFIQGRGPAEVTHRLRDRSLLPPDRSLAEVMVELEDLLGDQTLRRIAFDLQADQAGPAANGFLELLDESTEASGADYLDWTTEQSLHAAETRRTLDRIRAIMGALPPTERQVIDLRYGHGWTAKRIADELRLKDQREVYTISERALRGIRKLLGLTVLSIFLVFWRRPW